MRAPPRAVAILLLTLPLGFLADVGRRWETVPLRVPWGPPAVHYTFLNGDCTWYRATIVSLLSDGDLDQRNNLVLVETKAGVVPILSPENDVALGANGAWYPKHPILLSVLALPFYFVAGDIGLLAFNLVQLTALLIVAWYLLRRVTSDAVALAATWWLAFATHLLSAAYNFSPDVLSTLLVVAGYLALVSRKAAIAGALFGLACCSRWSNVVLLPVVGIFVLHGFTRRQWLAFGLPLAAFLLALGGLNTFMFGSPFITPYDRVIGSFQNGVPVLEVSHRAMFNMPFVPGLFQQLVHPSNGLITSGPHILFAPFGLALLWRRSRAETLLLGGICVVLIAFFAPYSDWRASTIGHRFLMTVVVLSALPATALLGRVLGAERAPEG